MSLVSVIIPTYNRAHLIKRAIQSVLNQTVSDFELIIVDDGSDDDTASVVGSCIDDRIIYVKQKQNRGQNAARNKGLERATGYYIAFLDSDDEWMPLMLEKQITNIKKGYGPSCSYSWAGRKVSDDIIPVYPFSLEGNVYKEALRQGFVSHMITLMIDKECLKTVMGFDENMNVCDDDDFCLRLAKHFPFFLVPEPLAIIHVTKNSVISDSEIYAKGWDKLISKFENEIVRNCGDLVMTWHRLRVGSLYANANLFSTWLEGTHCLLFNKNQPFAKKTLILFFKIFNRLYRWRVI